MLPSGLVSSCLISVASPYLVSHISYVFHAINIRFSQLWILLPFYVQLSVTAKFFFSRSSKCFSCVPSSRERRCFTRDNSYHNGRRTERQNKPISRPQANNPVSLSLKPFFLTMLIEMMILLWEMFGAVYVRDFVLYSFVCVSWSNESLASSPGWTAASPPSLLLLLGFLEEVVLAGLCQRETWNGPGGGQRPNLAEWNGLGPAPAMGREGRIWHWAYETMQFD